MKINSLELKNYRNYASAQINFNNGLNVLIGNNAQGKTNLLESIFLCSIGKSPRTNKDKDLILWNQELAKVSLNLTKVHGNKKIDVYISNKNNKSININQVPIKRIGELMGEFNSVYFSPDELKLVKESPDERRRFMDIHLSQFSKQYFYTLNKYNKILLQRNKLLKSTQDRHTLNQTLGIWNEQLASCATYIIIERVKLIDSLKIHANNTLNFLTDNKETMVLEYVGIKEDIATDLKEKLIKQYEKSVEKDINLGYTTVGPHRDDFKIVVNNIDIRTFGSQGQQRTSALALKLAELEVFKEKIGEYPVLLLDDVLSELDNDRQIKLLKFVSSFQTVLTGTSFNFSVPHTIFTIENGKVLKVNKIS